VFGHGWERAEGTIIDSRITKFIPVGPGMNELPIHEFVVDVCLQSGEVFRATVAESTRHAIAPVEIGDVVGFKVDPKTREVTFDYRDPRLDVDAALRKMKEQEQPWSTSAPRAISWRPGSQSTLLTALKTPSGGRVPARVAVVGMLGRQSDEEGSSDRCAR
jgi:hypothetical protein